MGEFAASLIEQLTPLNSDAFVHVFDVSRLTATMIHYEIPGFKAAREFCGRHDTCGPNALNELSAALWADRYGPVGCPTMNVIVQQMQRKGIFSTDPRGIGGCTMSELAQQANDMGFKIEYQAAWHWHPALDLTMVHNLIKSVRYDQNMGVLLQVGKAFELPDNEHGVDSHFVALGGVDSDAGYKVGNGDIPLGTFHGAEWVGWNSIAAAQPTAMMVLSHVLQVPVPVPAPAPVPPEPHWLKLKNAGWTDTANFDVSVFDAKLSSPNGHSATHGFRQDIFTNGLEPDDTFLMEETGNGTVTTLVAAKTTFEWSQSTGVTRKPTSPVGEVLSFILQNPLRPATQRQIVSERIISILHDLLANW